MKTRALLISLTFVALLIPLPPVAYADPPPWAPAHGWRKKHDPYYVGYSGERWNRDYGIIDGRCNRQAIGTVLGGVVGGAIGSTADREYRAVAVIVGSVLGAVVGNQIGKSMDEADRGCIGHALELAADRRAVTWSNPDSGLNYKVTPIRGFDADGRKCREYMLNIDGRGVNDSRKEKACQTGPGTWEPYR